MKLFYGVLFVCLSAILFSITLLGSRNPKNPKWAGEFIVSSFYIPVFMGILIAGIGLVSNASFFSDAGDLGAKEILLSGMSLAVSVLVIWRMRIPEKLKMFAAQETASSSEVGTTIEILPKKAEPEEPKPPSRRLAA